MAVSETQLRQLSMLRILLGVGETAVDAFRGADNPLDTEYVTDLERIVERTRRELDTLARDIAKPS